MPALAHNEVRIYKQGNFNCISSNGSPNHEIGKFPTKGNPNKFKAQKINYCYPNNPLKKRTFNNRASTVVLLLLVFQLDQELLTGMMHLHQDYTVEINPQDGTLKQLHQIETSLGSMRITLM